MAPITPILLGLLAAFLFKPLSNDLARITDNGSARILLLTAHPDDEAMFFAPTLLALKNAPPSAAIPTDASAQTVFSVDQVPEVPTQEIFSLCLSNGNADGLGAIRSGELAESLNILGVPADKRWIVDNAELQDNITLYWDPAVIAHVVLPYVLDNYITTILTFDANGISDHPNHKSLPEGVKELWKILPVHAAKPRLFTLISVPTLGKYTSFMGAALAKFDLYGSRVLWYYDGLINRALERMEVIPEGAAAKKVRNGLMPVFVSGYASYITAFEAMLAHKSQLVWFRWLYLAFSRYMWINEWAEVKQ